MAITGVTADSIGTSYDVAVGYADPTTGNTRMVGYTLALGTPWVESTDIQDETHIVQISTLSTDRFSRYPKQSQGDWSGGERQLFAPGSSAFNIVNFNQYYTSDGGINPTIPGNLQLFPQFNTRTIAGSTGQQCPLGTDGVTSFFIGLKTNTNNLVITPAPNAVPVSYNVGDGTGIVGMISDLAVPTTPSNSGVVCGFATATGIILVGAGGTSLGTYTTSPVAPSRTNPMAFFNDGSAAAPAGSIFFISQANPQQIMKTSAGTFTGGAATSFQIVPDEYGPVVAIFANPRGIYYCTQAGGVNVGIDGPIIRIWQSNGTTAGTIIGEITGGIMGGGDYNGVLYIITNVTGSFSQVGGFGSFSIYAIDGGNVNIFDDYRDLAQPFQLQFGLGATAECSVVGDGRYMYVSVPGTPVRVYDLGVPPPNPVFQMGFYSPGAGTTVVSHRLAIPRSGLKGGPFEIVYDSTFGSLTMVQSLGGAQTSGQINLSWMDFGAVGVIKRFRQLVVELAQPLPTPGAYVAAKYTVDNQTQQLLTLTPDTSGNLVGTFPAGLKGYRIQISLILQSRTTAPWTSPVVRSVALKATLGRAWKFSVSCLRNQRLRNQGDSPGEDPQGLRAQEKLANILNVYEIAAGNMVMMIPSPTQASGVETINCVLEDYQWKAGKEQPGPYSSEMGAFDMEGVCDLTVVENI
jgi:hypothetical protein